MKVALVFLAVLNSSLCFANSNTRTASDMARILKSAAVVKALASADSGLMESIQVTGSGRCESAPTIYSIMSQKYSDKGISYCRQVVQVGICGSASDRSVSLLGAQLCQSTEF